MATRLLIMALFCVISVVSEKKICDFDDDKCLTESAARLFIKFIEGTSGVESSDPLHLDLIEANLPTLKYKLIDASLTGMLNCQVELAQIFTKFKKYNYHVGCPNLVLVAKYEANGKLGPEFIEGTGTCKVDIYDYHFLFNGDLETEIDKNGKLHIQIKNHILEYEAKGKVIYDCKNLFNGDKEKSENLHQYANKNWQFVHKLTRQPVMEAFMNKFFDNINTYTKLVPLEDLFYYE